ncbi:MAG: amidohydrolase family protein [Marinovum algicola]|jgi:cytosine deaminase|uniref:Cytosine/adenosine deaminase n=1 Tax=Marinovum algicola TaxID=42444 RepID=A0A975WD09_9RHOB|nr:amidohydrolase family protein [Marinovum algicola]SEJ96539.1 Cytosine/adenosine deaminase [Marinovum algicola]SLN69439.1 N-isopropylammelide isopropyl amidohydrolase [Marinovum algicola]
MDILLKNLRPLGQETCDMEVRAGRIARIGKDLAAPDLPVEDCGGALALPGLVEAHTHLDKSLWGMGWREHQAGPSLRDKIDNERKLRKEWNIDPYRQSMRQALLSLGHGSTAIRSHVDIDTDCGLAGIEGVARTREELAGQIDIEIVAFPQSGLMSRPGTLELMERALQGPADVVGGLDPCGIDADPKGQLDAVFALAEKYGKPIDIHLHEPGELGAFSMEMILDRTRAHGMQGRVTISHAFCLGMPDRDRARALVAELAEAQVHIATVATPSRPVPLAEDLRAAGVVLCAGSDGIRDTWGPYGNADMLERAMLLGLRNNLRADRDVEHAFWCCSGAGARVMGLAGHGITEGCTADLVLVEAETVTHAVVSHPPRRLVLKAGRIVARDGKAVQEAP